MSNGFAKGVEKREQLIPAASEIMPDNIIYYGTAEAETCVKEMDEAFRRTIIYTPS